MTRAARRVLAVCALAILTGCAGEGDAAVTAGCRPVERLPDSGHNHLAADADPPVPYSTTPPTSGWHYRGADRLEEVLGVHEEALEEPEHVSALAIGGVVVSHRGLDPATRDELEALAGGLDRPVAVTPYAALDDGEVVLTAWATRQVCDGFDAVDVTAFIEEHADEEPDFEMSGEDHEH